MIIESPKITLDARAITFDYYSDYARAAEKIWDIFNEWIGWVELNYWWYRRPQLFIMNSDLVLPGFYKAWVEIEVSGLKSENPFDSYWRHRDNE